MPQNLAGRYFDLWKIKRDALQSLALSQLLSKVWKTSLVIIQHCSKTIPSLKGIFLLIQSRSFTYILNSSVSRQWFATAINVSSTVFFPWEWSRMILTSQDMLEGNQIEKYRKYVYPWFDLCLRCGWCPKKHTWAKRVSERWEVKSSSSQSSGLSSRSMFARCMQHASKHPKKLKAKMIAIMSNSNLIARQRNPGNPSWGTGPLG